MISLPLLLSWLILLSSSTPPGTFKQEQKRYPRVRKAYSNQEQRVLDALKAKNITPDQMQLYIRAFKDEKEIELWGKNKQDSTYQLIETFEVCSNSGILGPKREEGDMQVPEGFYYIDRFNPYSNFYLSLGINYPNRSDRILGNKQALGSDIFIHGNCVTVGCLPIEDEPIKALYVYCVEAKDNGQEKIPVTIFPARLSNAKLNELLEDTGNAKHKGLWKDLQKAFLLFNEHKQLPNIAFLKDGRHGVSLNIPEGIYKE
jgi:murein L,D-transpeptidase YafK